MTNSGGLPNQAFCLSHEKKMNLLTPENSWGIQCVYWETCASSKTTRSYLGFKNWLSAGVGDTIMDASGNNISGQTIGNDFVTYWNKYSYDIRHSTIKICSSHQIQNKYNQYDKDWKLSTSYKSIINPFGYRKDIFE